MLVVVKYIVSAIWKTPLLIVVASLCMFTGGVDAAALYKWIDEDGQIRYSDRLPATQVKKKHQQLNSQGVVVGTTEAAKSEEELAAEAEAKRIAEEQAAEEARLNQIQYEKDQVLLLTFSSERELELARDDRLEVLDSVIRLITKNITSTQKTLQELETSADQNYTSKGKEVPGGLAQKIEHFTRKIESRTDQLLLKVEEKDRINQQFEHDLARFRELRSESSSAHN
ncbi:MAG: DUF4124 domain-containing protein [Gammaproteobacteria bacterium]|nr:DUF4124 domain-containing protein [Gammaproteobacteria bacterium]